MLVAYFDPWKSELCTCPRKYSLNVYTGCGHACVYCYITSYIPSAFSPRVKKKFIKRLKKERDKLRRDMYISISNSSDPYQKLEREKMLTRAALKILKGFKKLIITKSDLVTRDLDLLENSSVSITLTTLSDKISAKLEPNAPSPERRLRALQRLVDCLEVSVRVDPIIPYLNEDFEALIKELADIGVKHVVSSTFKPRYDSWRRFEIAFPRQALKLKKLYFEKGSRYGNAYYLPRELRFRLMARVRKACTRHGLTFATCREGFSLNTSPTCDGSHLI